MRFTPSKDGKLRTEVRIPFRIGRDEIVDLMCRKASTETLEDQPINPSASWINGTVREILRRDGHETWGYWSDDVDEDTEEEIRTWAEAAVNGALPELRDE